MWLVLLHRAAINNINANVYGATIMTTASVKVYSIHLTSAISASTLRSSQLTWAVSPPVGFCRPQPPSPFISITQPERRYTVYRPTEGRRLSGRRHCSNSVRIFQSITRVYCSVSFPLLDRSWNLSYCSHPCD